MNWKVGIFIAIVGIAYCIFLGLMIKDSNECDELITFTDGTKIECISVSSYDNGMTHIKKCDNKNIIVPTIRIKEIVKK